MLSFVDLGGDLINFIGSGHGIYDCLSNMLKIIIIYNERISFYCEFSMCAFLHILRFNKIIS